MKRLLFLVLIAVAATLALRTFVIEGIYAATASMEPTLPVNTSLFLEKVTYLLRAPRRGEIVVFPSPVDGTKDLVKRVIAVPGDELEIRDKAVYLNGVLQDEPYVKHTRQQEILEGDNLGPLTVPPGAVFVMGDNRDESGDSRDWKDGEGAHQYFVQTARIKGKIIELIK